MISAPETPWLNLAEGAAYERRGKRWLAREARAGRVRDAIVDGKCEFFFGANGSTHTWSQWRSRLRRLPGSARKGASSCPQRTLQNLTKSERLGTGDTARGANVRWFRSGCCLNRRCALPDLPAQMGNHRPRSRSRVHPAARGSTDYVRTPPRSP